MLPEDWAQLGLKTPLRDLCTTPPLALLGYTPH